MLFDAAIIPTWLTVACTLLLSPALVIALRLAQWQALVSVPQRLHLLFGAIAGLTGLWLLNIRVADAFYIHLLAMTSVTLVLGWCFGLLCGSLALLALLLIMDEPLASLPLSWLFTVAVPATLSRWLLYRLTRLRIRNLFVYTLGGGFAGGIVCALAVAVLALPTLWLMGRGDLSEQGLAAWPMIALVLFPEGFINGMLVTAACVFFPQAVKTFDDGFYLGREDDSG